jgi:hypothetical protein
MYINKSIKWYSRVKLNKEIWHHVQVVDRVLDIGCGLEPQRFLRGIKVLLSEPCEEYYKHLKSIYNGNKNVEIIKTTMQQISDILLPESYDTIFLLDVIEHIDKVEALNALYKLEKIAKRQIIIRCPIGEVPQDYDNGIDPWGYKINSWQKHKSSWYPIDFNDYEILACKNYSYITGNGTINKIPTGEMYAIKNISSSGKYLTIGKRKQSIISLYDMGMALIAFVLKIIPEQISRNMINIVIKRLWKRVGA